MWRFVLTALLLMPCSAPAKTYSIAISDEYVPLFFPNEDDLDPRFKCPLEAAGFDYNLKVLPLARILYEMNQGRVAVGLPFTQADKLDGYATLSESLFDSRYLYITRKGETLDLSDPDQSVAYVRGFAGAALIEDSPISTYTLSSWRQSLILLDLGRVQGIIITERIYRDFDPALTTNFHERPAGSLGVGFYVGNKFPELLEALNQGIRRCRQQD